MSLGTTFKFRGFITGIVFGLVSAWETEPFFERVAIERKAKLCVEEVEDEVVDEKEETLI